MLAYETVRVLLISPASPWPVRRGYQLRAAHLAETLALRHSVSVVAQHVPGSVVTPPPPGIEVALVPHGRLSRARGAMGVARRPVQVALHGQRALRQAVAAAVARNRPDVAVLVLSRLGDVVSALDGVPLVVDFVDALALNMAHRAARQPWLGPLWRWESRRMAAWDRRVLARAHAATVVAERDRSALRHNLGAGEGSPIHVVPLGMSLESAMPLASKSWVVGGPAGPPTVVLTGNLGYFPTVEGAQWFACEVWPLVREVCPDARWRLAGARPAAPLGRLHGQHGIEVVANPPDLTAIRRQGHVAIAPLRAGSGTPIKILEAMADGVPVVTTEGGRAGLDEIPDSALAVSRSAEAMATDVMALLRSPARAEAQATSAHAWLRARHDWHAVGQRFEAIVRAVASGEGA